GSRYTYTDSTVELLRGLGTTAVTIVGGPNSVNDSLISDSYDNGMTATRIAGASRYETSEAINAASFAAPTERVFLASGTGFADALAGDAVAARFGAPLYVVPPECVSRSLQLALERLGTEHVTLVGGEASLSPAVAKLKRC
ncbi:MAG: cell wall-binding repeat-containing protein, partial [Herbiconiux sp.]|nr:cell wall-binding repeat-containing protein [Herbiconiux sp.]